MEDKFICINQKRAAATAVATAAEAAMILAPVGFLASVGADGVAGLVQAL